MAQIFDGEYGGNTYVSTYVLDECSAILPLNFFPPATVCINYKDNFKILCNSNLSIFPCLNFIPYSTHLAT